MNKTYLKSLLAALAICALAPAQAADFTNSIGMQFITIPAGSFYMGSCKLSAEQQEKNKKHKFMGLEPEGPACPSGAGADSDARDRETPQHRVSIAQAFQLGAHEVTLGQFKQFIAGAERYDLLSDSFMKYNRAGDNAAVAWVSWQDAQAFIKWLNGKEGGERYRLPSEAEWEYAARAGTTTRYSWGDSGSEAGAYAWYDKNAYDRGEKYAHAVGAKQPNPWGLYDMHGNVYEWTQDCRNYSYRGAPSDGSAWLAGDCSVRVLRGGSWYYNQGVLRSANRNYDTTGYRNYRIGFRAARTLD